ncbi:MAG: hypothetical protein ACYS0C_04285 [Planctomycetota bacterium]|jgi:hypothetical protein
MAEEKEEKKKAGIVKLIFKWIGLAVLSALIILGLIFEAPWKVITLLLIVLAACRILPKPAVKWFWLSVGLVIIALIIWIFLPDDTEGWKPYTFDEELAALEAKRAIPDEENAAIIYNQLLGKYNLDVCPIDPNADVQLLLPVREPWKSNEHPRLAQWLQGKKREIDKLLEASKIEKCRFPIDADLVTSTQGMERLSAVRQWAYWLVTMANNDRAEGRADEALEKEIAVLRIAEHQYQQATMVEMLVGIAIESFGIQQLKRFVVTGDAAEDELTKIEIALGRGGYDWSSDFPRVLDQEKLFAKNLWGMFYVVNPEGKVRLNPVESEKAMMAQLPEDMKDEPVVTYWHRRIMKIWGILFWFYMPSTPQKAGKVIDEGYEKYYAMAEPDFDWRKEPKEFTKMIRLNYRYLVERSAGGMFGSLYYKVHDTYLRLTADTQGSGIIIALRRYKNQNGFWPVNLDDVKSMAPAEIFVDPHNNGRFVYKLTDGSFTLYSKGKNNIDEDGERDEQSGADDWLIWPPRTGGCETEEESMDAEQQ